jgi:penicillin-binding protein 1A
MSRRDRRRRRRRNRGSALKRFAGMTVLLVICTLAVGALAIAGWVVNVAQSAPDLSSLRPRVPGTPSEVFAADGTSLGYIWSPNLRVPVSGSVIPLRLKEATIAIEDRRFYQHGALDYQGIVRAAIKDALNGGSLQGASTLTMQLVDNVYLPPSYRAQHDLKYKIIQAKLAEQLEGRHHKNWILNSYLNDVPYGTLDGQTAYGVGAASQLFFDKPVQDLTLVQAALLAGLPQAPSDYNPFLDPAAARNRRAEVLQSMVTAHYITQAQADAADRHGLEVTPGATRYQVRNEPYLFDFVEQQLAQDLCPKTPLHCRAMERGGMKVYTTIDLRKEAIAQQAILNHESLLAEQGGPGSAAAGLASVDPANGDIEALATSSSYSQTKFDYATQARRQPGSSFKTFALMTLIHDYHADPNLTYYDSHFLAAGWLLADPTWSVHTAEETYQGEINVTRATIVSDNTVYAQLAADLGWAKLDATAHAMGINSPLDGNPAEVIGGLRIGVTPLEMADAYATLANGGSHVPATIIGRVVFANGTARNFGDPAHTAVFPYDQAYEGTSVLRQVITEGTGTAANYGCPAAGKTGTAENLENAWFVGYTPRMSTAVWVGYPQGNIPMADGFGGTLAAPIWHDYMEKASGSYCGDFPAPTTPFVGTAFFGHFSELAPLPVFKAPAPKIGSSGGSGIGAGTSTTGTGTTGTGVTATGVTGNGVTGTGVSGTGVTGNGTTATPGQTGAGTTGTGVTGNGTTATPGQTGAGTTGTGATGNGTTGTGATGNGTTGTG